MDTQSAFKRAALYQSCKQSNILSNIDYENTNTEALVDLVNQHNAHSIRELPILLTKAAIKAGVGILAVKFPKVATYVNPDQISVKIEDDEMAYLISTKAKRPANIVAIVAKNIIVSSIGSSIIQLKNDILSGDNGTRNEGEPRAKIDIGKPEGDRAASQPVREIVGLGLPWNPDVAKFHESRVD